MQRSTTWRRSTALRRGSKRSSSGGQGISSVTETEVRRRARALAFLPRTALLSRSFADDSPASPALDTQQPHKSPLAVRLDAAVMLERGRRAHR